MLNVQTKSQDIYVSTTLELLQAILADYPVRDFAIRLWDGTIWQQEAGQPRYFTLVLNHSTALRRMFLPPTERRLGEAYIFGDFDLEGDLVKAMNFARYLWETWRWTDTLRYGVRLLRLPEYKPAIGDERSAHLSGHRHTLERDEQAIRYHYDVSNDFYQLWLDKNMVYSCAYFTSADEDIDTAQERKLDYVCRKLRLKPGERLLDIGCGWGALLIHAAKHYGVHATGITLSEKQIDYARQRIAAEGLSEQCQVELLDYRAVDEAQGFDKIVSVGMVEHVGRKNLLVYFEQAYRLLRPGGVFLNHGITASRQSFTRLNASRNSFAQQYVFPDGDLQPLDYLLTEARKARFEIRDVENLREHYALTLKNWFERYEAQKQEVLKILGTVGYRQWRIYLAAARWMFEYGLAGLHQVLLYKPGEDVTRTNLPLTRDDWYG